CLTPSFFCNDTPATAIYTLSLHDALPISPYEKGGGVEDPRLVKVGDTYYLTYTGYNNIDGMGSDHKDAQLCLATSSDLIHWKRRSEEHTSELQSRENLVCRLLLEKKKKRI